MKWACFSPVCSRMCTFMLPEVEKHFRQHWHSKALIPVCVFMCAVRVLLTAKALKHCLHLKGFSWVWMRMWRTRSLGFLNSLEQYGQPCQRTPFSSLMEPGNEGRVKQMSRVCQQRLQLKAGIVNLPLQITDWWSLNKMKDFLIYFTAASKQNTSFYNYMDTHHASMYF